MNSQIVIKIERLDFSRRIQPEDARQRLLEKQVRDKNLADMQVERTINDRLIDRERREDHQTPRYRRSPERSPREMDKEREEESRHNSPLKYRRYQDRTASHQKGGWSPSPPKLSREFRFNERLRRMSPQHNDQYRHRSPYNSPPRDYYESPSQRRRGYSPQESQRDREEREYDYEKSCTGYGRGAGYNKYRR